jgi:hypothetical protein
MSDLFPIYQLTEEMQVVTDRPKQLNWSGVICWLFINRCLDRK